MVLRLDTDCWSALWRCDSLLFKRTFIDHSIVSVFKRQIIKGSLFNFLGIGLGVLNNIWLFPLAFTLEELGIYRWVERTAVLIAAIALLGMHRTYVRYQSQRQARGQSIFIKYYSYSCCVTGISGIGFTLFASRIAVLLDVPVADEILYLEQL